MWKHCIASGRGSCQRLSGTSSRRSPRRYPCDDVQPARRPAGPLPGDRGTPACGRLRRNRRRAGRRTIYMSPNVEECSATGRRCSWRSARTGPPSCTPTTWHRWPSGTPTTRAAGEPFDMEYRFVHPDGRIVWVHDRAMIVAGHEPANARLAGRDRGHHASASRPSRPSRSPRPATPRCSRTSRRSCTRWCPTTTGARAT